LVFPVFIELDFKLSYILCINYWVFHKSTILIFIEWYIGSSCACDPYWGFLRSPTPRHIGKEKQVRDLILIRLMDMCNDICQAGKGHNRIHHIIIYSWHKVTNTWP
jgi:hypothetical protein